MIDLNKLPKEDISVICNNYFEFRKLLKLAYEQGYEFSSKKRHKALDLYLNKDVIGLTFYTNNSIRYIEESCEVVKEAVEFNEYLKIIHGLI